MGPMHLMQPKSSRPRDTRKQMTIACHDPRITHRLRHVTAARNKRRSLQFARITAMLCLTTTTWRLTNACGGGGGVQGAAVITPPRGALSTSRLTAVVIMGDNCMCAERMAYLLMFLTECYGTYLYEKYKK